MNSRREERAHRLADEVGRRDAGDPEPVRDLGRDRRLAGAGRAADQHDDRHVERLQVGEPPQAADRRARPRRRRASRAASVRSRSRSTRPLAALGEVDLDPARERRTRGRRGRRRRSARAPSRPSSTAGPRSPSGSGSPWRRWLTSRPAPGASASSRVVEPVGDDVVRGEHDAPAVRERRARRRRRSRRPSPRRGTCRRRPRELASRAPRGRRGSRETWTTSASR